MAETSPQAKSPLRTLREARGLTLVELASALTTAAIAADGDAALKWDTGGLSRAERSGVRSLKRAADLVKFFGGGINEIELLYPDRWPK
ncbi:MAG: XRE family transcriptional regulator [Betaproteobacteria bacterium]